MKERIEFLTTSINDIQGTIRAIDAKFFGIFAILILPLTELDEISKAFKELYVNKPTLCVIVLSILVISWVLDLIVCMLGIYTISSPVQRIKDNETYDSNNLFYRANLFSINLIKQFTPVSIKSAKSLETLIKEAEIDELEIFKELAFEQLKLAYIRDLKIARQRLAIILLVLTVLIIAGVLIVNTVF